jgi:hypothetical protein
MGNKNDLAAVETPLQTVDQNIEIRHVFVYLAGFGPNGSSERPA